MRLQVLFIVVCFGLFLAGSCSKKETHPASASANFFPASYLPVYPGSWWKYVNGTDTTVSRTSDSILSFEGLRLTSLDGWPINGYKKYYYNSMYDMGWVKVLSETIGESWSHLLGDARTNPYTQFTRVMQKTIDTHGDSVIIQRYNVYHADPPLYNSAYTWQIFKKNVGLVFECKVDTTNQDTIYKKVLVDFHINRK